MPIGKSADDDHPLDDDVENNSLFLFLCLKLLTVDFVVDRPLANLLILTH